MPIIRSHHEEATWIKITYNLEDKFAKLLCRNTKERITRLKIIRNLHVIPCYSTNEFLD